MPALAATAALRDLWQAAALPQGALGHVRFDGAEPVLPSAFPIATAAAAAIAAVGLAAASIDAQRGGAVQDVAVDLRHAATEFRSERHLRVAGATLPDPWDAIAGAYRCRDGWVRLHTNFPHHRDGIRRLLGCAHDRTSVARALLAWDAVAFETAAAEAGLVGSALRSFAAWDAHPQTAQLAAEPLVWIERIGDAPPRPLPPASRPLAGMRVLDLTRVIAGPVCGRALAAHGADVLLITAPHLPAIAPLVIDTGRGKLSARLDLRAPAEAAILRDLLASADIFVQGYRPGGLDRLGFAPHDTARLRPGIVHVSLTAYGFNGPWASRRGFDSLVQTATGFNVAEAAAFASPDPRPLPAQALDHAAGYLMAFGALAALHRRATEGGSWHVRVSLARTGLWLRGLPRLPDGPTTPEPTPDAVARFLDHVPSGFGPLTTVRHAAILSRTPAVWDRPSSPLGTHAPAWPT